MMGARVDVQAKGDAGTGVHEALVGPSIEASAFQPAGNRGRTEVVFVDASVTDCKMLEASVRAGIEIREIDPSRSGLAQMADWAQRHDGYDAIHILSHGSSAVLHLGTDTITTEMIASAAARAMLAQVGHSLKANGDLLIYGCYVAQGAAGRAWLSQLAAATGADVAASTDATGAGRLGGNWTLERAQGQIETESPFEVQALQSYSGLLATFDLSSATGTGTKTVQQTVGSDTAVFTSVLQGMLVDTDTNIWGGGISGVSGKVLATGQGGVFYESQVTLTVSGNKTFDLASMVIVDMAGENKSLKITTDKGTQTLSTAFSGNSWSVSFSGSMYVGITYAQITTGHASGQFAWAFDNFVLNNITASAPTVTDARISISGASGTGGAYKIGDTVTATWNNTAGGDNNSGTISSVTVNFSQFGGGSLVPATNSGGTWTATYTIASGAGSINGVTNRNISVTATDSLANSTTTADTTNATVDNVAPTITFSSLAFSADTGSSSTDFITATAAQTVTATLSATPAVGDIVYGSLDNGSTWTDITNKVSGTTLTWNGVTLTSSSTLKLKVTDAAGNNGVVNSQAYILDTSAPSAPSTPDMTSGTDTGVSNSDNITSNTTPTFSGSAESGSSVTLYDTDGVTVLGTATAFGGNWSITSSTLSSGSHTLTAKATDAAGNRSSASSSLSVTIDTTAPTVSSVSVPSNGVYKIGDNVDFTVNMSEAVTVVVGGGTPRIALVLGSATVYANYISGTGTGALVFRYTVAPGDTDTDGIMVGALSANGGTLRDVVLLDATLTLNSVGSTTAVLVDGNAPSVSAIVRAGANPTHATSVDYTVTFSESVSGVDMGDFTLTATSTAAGTVASVTPVSGSVYTVTVSGVASNGTLRLDLKSSGTGITDTPGNPISGGFTSGQTYTIDTTAPALTSIQRQLPAAVNVVAATATWRVTFSEGVTGVDATDFTLTTVSGTASGTITGISPVDTTTYDVTVASLSGRGQLRLDLKASGTGIADLAGVALADGGFTAGDVYLVGTTSVFDATSLSTGTTRSVSAATTNKAAQRFTTSASAPLSMVTVAVMVGNVSGSPVPVATIHADNGSGGFSATVIGTLTNPASLTPQVLNVWTSNSLLSANTSYWIVFDDASSSGAYELQTTAATTGGSGNWLTNADYFYRYGAAAGTGPQAGALRIALGASAVPTITSSLTANGTYGTPFTYTITATNTPTSFAATGLPSGLTVNTATGQISGTPTQAGGFNVLLTTTNANGTGQTSTLVLTAAKAQLTVTTVSQSRVYSTANPALTVNYSGFVGADSATSLTTAPVATTSAVLSSPVGLYAITAGGGASSDYAFNYVAGGLTITQATAAVNLSGLSLTYNGSPQAAIASTTPVGLPVALTYDGSASVPSAPGSYAVVATVTDTNYQGTASGTLTIAKIPVTVSLSGLTAIYDGSAKVVTVTTTPSGVTASATYNGSAAAPINAGGYAVLATVNTATQIGSASGTLTIAKASQTITFAELSGRDTASAPFVLGATASSGLPVTYTVVGGPALLSGSTVTLTGVPGDVTIKASQSGDANHFAAADVSRTFTVISAGPRVFIGDILGNSGSSKEGDLAAVLPPSGNDGNLMIMVPTMSVALAIDFTLGPDGTFVKVVTGDNLPTQAASAATARNVAADTRTLTLRGQLVGNVFSGHFDEIDLVFSITVQARGSTANYAGFYRSIVLNSDTDAIYTVVGNNSEVLVVAKIANTVVTGRGVLNSTGGFDVVQNNVTVTGAINSVTATVLGRVTQSGVPDISFSGVATTSLRTDRLINLSSLARVTGIGEQALVTGFVIGGTNPKRVLLRAVGPTLASFGVATPLANPRLQLFDGAGHTVLENDDWGGTDVASVAAQTGAFTLPAGSRDAAMVTTLNPGTYTMQVTDGTQSGTVLAEIYDASVNPTAEFQRLINISSRGMVDGGRGVLIGGFYITGNSPKKVLIRAAGPALAPYGINGYLADPRLTLFSGQTPIAQNDNWGTAVTIQSGQTAASAAEIVATAQSTGAFAFPAGSKDAALIVSLAPGPYTAQISSATGTSGVAMIEIYEVP